MHEKYENMMHLVPIYPHDIVVEKDLLVYVYTS